MKVATLATIEVPTGGDPQRAVAGALVDRGLEIGAVYHLTVAHDEGCPCTERKPLHVCTCEIVRLIFKRRVR